MNVGAIQIDLQVGLPMRTKRTTVSLTLAT